VQLRKNDQEEDVIFFSIKTRENTQNFFNGKEFIFKLPPFNKFKKEYRFYRKEEYMDKFYTHTYYQNLLNGENVEIENYKDPIYGEYLGNAPVDIYYQNKLIKIKHR